MSNNYNPSQAGDIADMALGNIKKNELAPTPNVFELWYVYHAGQNPDVVRALDVLLSNKQKITQDRCVELHNRFVSNQKAEEGVRRAGDQISATLKNVTNAVNDVRTATTEYNGKLDGFSGEVSGITDPAQLQGLLQNVMAETKQMMDKNDSLEAQLEESTKRMGQLQESLDSVRKEALTDALTNLSNRKAFDAALDRITTHAEAENQAFSLMMIDIDHFKSFNDNYGHQVGDQVLRLVAKTLVDGVKGKDVAARYGGEEFSIILPDTPLQAASLVAEALRKAVATKDIVNRNSGDSLGQITVSIGVADYVQGESTADLIERADAALYTAKNNGRNQVAQAPSKNAPADQSDGVVKIIPASKKAE